MCLLVFVCYFLNEVGLTYEVPTTLELVFLLSASRFDCVLEFLRLPVCSLASPSDIPPNKFMSSICSSSNFTLFSMSVKSEACSSWACLSFVTSYGVSSRSFCIFWSNSCETQSPNYRRVLSICSRKACWMSSISCFNLSSSSHTRSSVALLIMPNCLFLSWAFCEKLLSIELWVCNFYAVEKAFYMCSPSKKYYFGTSFWSSASLSVNTSSD